MAENIIYDVQANSDLSELQQVIQGLNRLGDSLDDIAQQQRETAQSAEEAADAQKDMAEAAKGLQSAWQGIKSLGIAGIFASIVGIISQGIGQVRDWALEVDNLSNMLSISTESANALAVSWRLSGVEAEQAAGLVESFQGRLIDELEAQKEAAKAVADIQKQRVEVEADYASQILDHNAKITELETERAELSSASFEKVTQDRDKALGEAEKDYARFLSDQEDAERRETTRLEEVWKDRAKSYERAFEDLRGELTDNARRARNFKEFQEARADFEKKKRRLTEDLNDEQTKHKSTAERRIDDAKAAADREKELFEEKKQAIITKSDEEVAKLQERNQKAIENVNKRIEQENKAFDSQGETFNDRMESLAEAQAEAQDKGAGLSFVMQQLGVDMFDADGKMRPVDELLWDMKAALEAMPEGAEKAAIISDLGWADMAFWLNEGVGATEAMQFAQENGLEVTDETIEAIREQNRQIEELKLKALGLANDFLEHADVFEFFLSVLEKVNDGMDILNQIITILGTEGGFDALIEGFKETGGALAAVAEGIEKIKEALGIAQDLVSQTGQISDALKDNDLGFLDLLGATGTAIGQELGFQGGGFTGSGPSSQVAGVTHRNEFVVPEKGALVLRENSSGGGMTININAPVFGVDDLNQKIDSAITAADRGGLMTGVRP